MNEIQRELHRIKGLKAAIEDIKVAKELSDDIRTRMFMSLENHQEDLVRTRIRLASLLRSSMGGVS